MIDMTQSKLTDIEPETSSPELPDWPDRPDMTEYTPDETPLPDPDEIYIPAPDPVVTVDDQELNAAVQRLLANTSPLIETPLHEAIADLPRWLDDEDKPDRAGGSGPLRCDTCDASQPWLRPLEKGRELALAGDDGNPAYTPCGAGKFNVESCTCCGCPECFAKSIYARKQMTPTYRCRNPDCKAEFEHPVELPLDHDIRRCLYWECRYCNEPTLAPFEGIPEGMI